MQELRIAVFAAGKMAYGYINRHHDGKIVAVFDNDKSKWGTLFCGYEVLPPYRIIELEFDYLVIASKYDKEIRTGLINNNPELANKICSIYKMDQLENVFRKYRKRYAGEKRTQITLENKKVVIYTGIFGNYDVLREPLYRDDDVDYICYTDDKSLVSEGWEIRCVENQQDNMALEVRKYKCLPHRFLAEYDISIWIDARLQIVSSLIEYIKDNMCDTGILFFPHNARDCVYEEGAANIIQHREDVPKLIMQMYKYNQLGYPEHNGLYWGGCIVRNHNQDNIIKTMEDWYEEILDTSARDQISLPYVLWKNNIEPDLCNKYCWDNELFKLYTHNNL